MKEEERANEFLYRSTFGTGPRGYAKPPRNGLNEDPWQPPLLSKIVGNALKVDIKNSANTQVISFGGKVLALFEAGLPHQLDPKTLKTIGEDTLGGVLKKGIPVKLGTWWHCPHCAPKCMSRYRQSSWMALVNACERWSARGYFYRMVKR